MEEIYCIVRGRVQLVMFRDFACRKGRGLGLVGYAKNLADGTVEVVAQGPKDKLEAYIAKLHKGSLLSRVDEVQVNWRQPSALYKGFTIAH